MNKIIKGPSRYIGLLTCVLWFYGCATNARFKPPRTLPDDRQDISQPKPREIYLAEDTFVYGLVHPTQKLFDISRHLRGLVGTPKQALNVDAFGEVQDSSWFTNRNGRRRLSLEEIRRGPDRETGPDQSGPWIISSAKEQGYTPGFNIVDARGDRYLLKFDPFGYPELSTGAEVITTKLLYAAGYNVPENYIVSFDPNILEMGDKCIYYDELGKECEMTTDDFDRLLGRIQPLPDGRFRAMASKFLGGKLLGGFRYLGTREDDPNDIVPHEHRRELRGLYILCSWLNHFDIKDANTLDMYVEDNGRSYVKHYLIDFGSTLGSTTRGPMEAFRGKETEFDTRTALSNLVTLGLKVKPWEKAGAVPYPSIGRFDTAGYDPGSTRMNYSNPALANRTNIDGFWAAKLVMSFTDEQLKIVVNEGQYSDPAAAFYLLSVLKERRDMTGRYWYSRVNVLDDFRIETRDGETFLSFTDKGLEGRLWPQTLTQHRYTLLLNGETIRRSVYIHNDNRIPLSKLEKFIRDAGATEISRQAGTQWQIVFKLSRDQGRTWGKDVRVYFKFDPDSSSYTIIGIRRSN